MQRDFTKYLCDISNFADEIFEYTAGFDLDQFAASIMVQRAVERLFEIIGEAITQIRHHHLARAKALGDVQSVVNFRNYLAHRYDSTSHDIVWDILQNDLPTLQVKVRDLLGDTQCRRR